ncbi:MAG: nicotinamide-nucleotide amidohydrolase family protein [Acholeplasmatales bacterium]|jgi:nicotinamide-nucleotide amidase|nr:nicotinamide-nucleotide amidohydrolase family protein [Acholeplasmatales bacterium]
MNIKKVLELLVKEKKTIGFAESMTGGSASAEITKLEGASKVFKGSIITYTNEIKEKFLDEVTENVIIAFGVVSKEVALRMARSVRKALNVDIGISITGYASIDSSIKERRVFVGFSTENNEIAYEVKVQNESRVEVINLTVNYIYTKLEELLEF